MKTILLSIAFVVLFSFFGCSNSEEKKQNDLVPADTSKGMSVMSSDSTRGEEASLYTCPCGGCPEVKESKPGKCPKCGLELTKDKK